MSFLRGELEAARAQHDAYKAKAKKVLAEKEKIIAGLREGGGRASSEEGGGEVGGGGDDAELKQAL